MELQAPEKQGRVALALTVALFIAACGGGGGGGGNSSNNGNPGGGGTTPTNTAPSISGEPVNSVSAGTEFSFTPTATDADNDTLTFSIENAPVWAVFDTGTGQLTGTPFAADLGEHLDITISVSDGTASTDLAPFSLTVTPQKLGAANFSSEGQRTDIEGGFRSVGTLILDSGERVQEFQNSDISVTFDEDGNLLDIVGETDLPVNLSDYISVNPGVRAVVGSLSGAEINANPDFGIQLMDDIRYLVFYVGADFSLTISNPTDPSEVIVEDIKLPIGGKIVLIADSTDPMVHRYGELLVPADGSTLARGRGDSFNRLLPFRPDLDFPGPDSFNGNKLIKSKMLMALFPDGAGRTATIEGTRVTSSPDFAKIDWDDPLNSPLQFAAGVNGTAEFALTVPVVGEFNFADTAISATYDVGLVRQHLALALNIDVDPAINSNFVPDWFHVLPRGEFNGEGSANATGEYHLEIYGNFQSTLPEANIAGAMRIGNDGVAVSGSSIEGEEALGVELEFFNNTTIGRIAFPESYTESIVGDVSAALDREIAAVEQALQDLQSATADYEFEASLRGLREALPAMMDAAVNVLEGIPDTVYNNRRYSRRITVTRSFDVIPFGKKTLTLYDETYSKNVLSSSDADKVAFARDNVWRIQATSDIMIQAQQIYDLLPTEEVIDGVKQGVQDGTQQVPLPEGLGYRAIGDTYDALVTIDGVDHIIEINVLKPSEVRTGVNDLLADILLEPFK